MTLSFVTMAVLTWAAVYLTIWARVSKRTRALALALALVNIGVALVAENLILSRPKPASLEFFQAAKEAEVVGARMVEEQGIYLLLQLPGLAEPRYYVLPWDRKLAEQLQAAQEQAGRNGTGVKMVLPFEPSLDEQAPKFYALPQPALPPKELYSPPPAEVYEVPASANSGATHDAT